MLFYNRLRLSIFWYDFTRIRHGMSFFCLWVGALSVAGGDRCLQICLRFLLSIKLCKTKIAKPAHMAGEPTKVCPPYGRVLLFSVLRVVFSLQNQHPTCEFARSFNLPYGRVLLFSVYSQLISSLAGGGLGRRPTRQWWHALWKSVDTFSSSFN